MTQNDNEARLLVLGKTCSVGVSVASVVALLFTLLLSLFL